MGLNPAVAPASPTMAPATPVSLCSPKPSHLPTREQKSLTEMSHPTPPPLPSSYAFSTNQHRLSDFQNLFIPLSGVQSPEIHVDTQRPQKHSISDSFRGQRLVRLHPPVLLCLYGDSPIATVTSMSPFVTRHWLYLRNPNDFTLRSLTVSPLQQLFDDENNLSVCLHVCMCTCVHIPVRFMCVKGMCVHRGQKQTSGFISQESATLFFETKSLGPKLTD